MSSQSEKSRVRHETVSDDRAGQRLDNFLMANLGKVPRSLIYRLVRTGQVRVNGRRAKPMKKLAAGDEVRIPPVKAVPESAAELPESLIDKVREKIIHMGPEFAVIDKPSGLAMHGGSGIQYGLIDVLHRIDPAFHPVHRLDRFTSGLVVVARNRKAAVELQRVFRDHAVDKRYLALLSGALAEATTTVNAPLKKIRDASGQHRVIVAEDGQPALTRFTVLEHFGGFSYVEAKIETGRTHQIRAHAASIGHPVIGDDRYNRNQSPSGLKRLFLHAHRLRLPWPEDRLFNAPLPAELAAVLESLRQNDPTE